MKEYTEGTKMHDTIKTIGKGSVIQHGKLNDRLYLIKLKEQDTATVLTEIEKIVEAKKYSKIFGKIPANSAPLFAANGYLSEAFIPRFYNNQEAVFFMSKFLSSDRLLNIENDKLKALHKLFTDNPPTKSNRGADSGYSVHRLNKTDIPQITDIYKKVFETYPFPIHNPEYVLKTMEENVQYFGAKKDGELAALASSEIDFEGKNAEMTDFATQENHAGNRLSSLLLEAMEQEMKKQGIATLYTIARLNSIPMNKTFYRLGYTYSGTLIKNTNISGKIESMNVYYKQI